VKKLFVVVASFMLASSCAGPGIQAQVNVVHSDIDKAKRSGAYQCAPRELAMAETSVDFAENELAQGDFMRARQHIETAVENANLALKNSKDCAPKRVLIKTKTDKDGDGILDDVDACPDQPEDIDLFQDEDGCPDPDNDNDTVLDPLDKCPNTAGPVENEGCPYGDRDGDGINDKTDACPDAPEDKDGDRDQDGRPDVDVDQDGVEDCTPGCPLPPGKDGAGKEIPPPPCDTCTVGAPEQTKEDKDNFEDSDGCPELDNDKDGVLDPADECPLVPGPVATNGCPDRDGDKIADKDDKCPDEPGIPRPDDPSKHGCPRLDKDGDRFYDDEDACPDKPGVSWEGQDDWKKKNPKGGNGCPPPLTLVIIKKDRIELKQQPQFDTAKATIKPASAELLRQVATAIRTMQDVKKIIIEGHTDDVGGDDYNMGLSTDRANSVRLWLIEKEKIDPSVLESVGYGETRPIASNRTSAGRQQNRRVDFKVERTDEVKEVPMTPTP
jgi:OmpA-OmpF porin, OOP family